VTFAARTLLLFLLALIGAPALAQNVQPTMTGDVRIHDPSAIEVDGRFAAFGTGSQGPSRGAIQVKASLDGVNWTNAGVIGGGVPAWAQNVLGYRPVNVWAPSVSRRGGTVFLYYALSTFGGNASVIGLMTNDRFDVAAPASGWRDRGLVLKSDPRDDFNAIDPFRIDVSDGRAFLAFGSFWSGIKLRELDPVTGKPIRDDTPTIPIASRPGGAIEAPSLLEHGGRFYLFVSFDQCRKGVASTYNIRVGRAERIEGPYVDRDGKAMLEGGGTLMLATTGQFIGPGGQEPVNASKGEMLVYHYYDGADAGASKLAFSPLRWSTDGWPEVDPLPR
jgi:arabinan endo-1,5-alpha-L-arabinosidase